MYCTLHLKEKSQSEGKSCHRKLAATVAACLIRGYLNTKGKRGLLSMYRWEGRKWRRGEETTSVYAVIGCRISFIDWRQATELHLTLSLKDVAWWSGTEKCYCRNVFVNCKSVVKRTKIHKAFWPQQFSLCQFLPRRLISPRCAPSYCWSWCPASSLSR